MPLRSSLIISTALSPPPSPPPISSFHKSKTPHTPTVPCHLPTPLAAMPTFHKQMATASTSTTTLSNHLQTPLVVMPNFRKQSATTTATTTTLLNQLQTPLAVMPTFHKQKFAATTSATVLSNLASIAILLSVNSPSPSLASPSLNPLLPSTTPFSQSQNLLFGLEDGYVCTYLMSHLITL